MDWLRPAPKTPDEPADDLEAITNSLSDNQHEKQQWTLEGEARILKVLRARGFPATEMVPMLVELQAGRFLTQRDGSKAWNPASGDFDEPYTKPRYPSVAYDIRVAKLTRWTFEVDLDDGTVAAVMTSEEVPESEVNCVPESREERFRRVVHRLTMAGHHGERGYRVPKVVDGSSESKLPLVLESRTTPAGGSLLLMPRSTLHALFGGGPFTLCEHAISDFQKTQEPDWKPALPTSKTLLILLIAIPAVCFIVYITTLWFITPYSFDRSLSPWDLMERVPGAMVVVAALRLLWPNLSGKSAKAQLSMSDPLAFPSGCVKECPVFQKEKHPGVETEKPEDMRKLLDAMGVPAPMLLAAGTGTVRKRGPFHGAVVSNLDKYWSTVLILALWSPEFQKHLCNDSNGLFRWRGKDDRGLRYGPISAARLMHCGIMVLGRATIMPKDNFTKLYRTTMEGRQQHIHYTDQAHDDVFWIDSLEDMFRMKVGG